MRLALFTFIFLIVMTPHTARALSITPSVIEISAARGTVIQKKVSVINTKGMEQTYFVGILKFKASEEGESPVFIPANEDQTGLPQWIQLSFTEFRLAANTKADVPFEIAIPQDVNSGGYYAALTVSQAPGDVVAENGVLIEAKVASLILLTVEGETTEKLAVLDFTSKTAEINSIRSSITDSYTFRLQNQGNVHVTPVGLVQVKDVFGRTVASHDANPEKVRILPGSTRSFDVLTTKTNRFWRNVSEQMRLFAFGPMTAQLSIVYGSSNTSIEQSFSYWYIPWQLLTVIGGVLIVLIGIWQLLHRKKTH